MLMWHKKGEQRIVETCKQKTHTGTLQDHRKRRKRNTDTHTETKTGCWANQGSVRALVSLSRSPDPGDPRRLQSRLANSETYVPS